MTAAPARTFERACPEHRLLLLDGRLECPAGHSVLPDHKTCRALRGHGLANTLLWLVVEVSADGEPGRDVARVFGARVEWAAWFVDESALVWRSLRGRDQRGMSPAARSFKFGLRPGEAKLLAVMAA